MLKTLNLKKNEIVDLKSVIRSVLKNVYDTQGCDGEIEYRVERIGLSESELQTLISLANEIFNKGELARICNTVMDVSIQ